MDRQELRASVIVDQSESHHAVPVWLDPCFTRRRNLVGHVQQFTWPSLIARRLMDLVMVGMTEDKGSNLDLANLF